MKRLLSVFAVAVALILAGSAALCGQTGPEYKQQLLQAKKNDEALLQQWKNRRSQLDLAQAGVPWAKRFTSYAKPGEDPTSAMIYSAGPSDYAADVAECDQHIAMLTENIKYYDQELKKLEQPESPPVPDGPASGDVKVEAASADVSEDFKLDLDLNKIVGNALRSTLQSIHESNSQAIKSAVEASRKALQDKSK